MQEWLRVMTDYFLAANGVKQGGVLNSVLFCIYTDGLLAFPAQAGYDCYFGKLFMGTLAYANDTVLLAPSPTAFRKTLEICDTHTLNYNICFHAKKSKCLIVAPYSQHYLRDDYIECTFYSGNKQITQLKL
jgi:Reverse transcriptase (RNA-dependent DNA polymerase)